MAAASCPKKHCRRWIHHFEPIETAGVSPLRPNVVAQAVTCLIDNSLVTDHAFIVDGGLRFTFAA